MAADDVVLSVAVFIKIFGTEDTDSDEDAKKYTIQYIFISGN